jgi:transportin-1
MLAIGAVAKGAEESITPHLNDLYPFLLQNTENENPLVKIMAIWTISRFTKWILAKASENINIFKEYFIQVLKSMLDDYQDAHKAACTAFSKICNADTTAIVEYLSDILKVLTAVGEKYKGKQAGSLYDVLSTIASNLDESVVQNEAVETVLMSIIKKNWEISTFDDAESNILIECTDTILGALGSHIYNYLEFFVPKLLILIANYLKARQVNESLFFIFRKKILKIFIINVKFHYAA